MNTTATLLPFNYIDRSWKKFVGKNLFSAVNPNNGIKSDLCIVIVARIERIGYVSVFLIVTLLFASVHVHGIVGLQAASQTNLTLR
jgi:hypothetical protein